MGIFSPRIRCARCDTNEWTYMEGAYCGDCIEEIEGAQEDLTHQENILRMRERDRERSEKSIFVARVGNKKGSGNSCSGDLAEHEMNFVMGFGAIVGLIVWIAVCSGDGIAHFSWGGLGIFLAGFFGGALPVHFLVERIGKGWTIVALIALTFASFMIYGYVAGW